MKKLLLAASCAATLCVPTALILTAQAQAAEPATDQATLSLERANRVSLGYRKYIWIQYCYQIREGYLLKYVNDIQLQRSAIIIKAIVDKAKQEEPSLDTDKLWNKERKETEAHIEKISGSVSGSLGNPYIAQRCNDIYVSFLYTSRISPYVFEKP